MKNLSFIILFIFLMTPVFGAGRQQLKCNTVPHSARLYPLGPKGPNDQLHLVLEFPTRNKAEQDQFTKNLYDPKSPLYHHYLTPQEYSERFGPLKADYEAVAGFFKARGFKIKKYPSRVLLDINGSVKLIAATFHVTLIRYKHPSENRIFYAPDIGPSVDLDTPLLAVYGLDDFVRLHPRSS